MVHVAETMWSDENVNMIKEVANAEAPEVPCWKMTFYPAKDT
jgi:hypothetical protein